MGMSSADQLVGQVLQQTYRIERLIGEGGMGAVYEASHLRLARRFAVKVLFPAVAEHHESLARFRREAMITSELGHPHILEVIDFNQTIDGAQYIIMELLKGEDLAARLQRHGHLSLSQAASIFRQTSSALEAAHQKGIIHRDLKPHNIFLCRRGKRDDFVKVVDFGISKVLGSQSVVTQTHALLGTPFYMAPEQAEQRASEVDARTDIFAMGSIVFEMLAGRPPFVGDSIPTLLYQITHRPPPSLRKLRPDVPKAVERVINRAMKKRPQDRFPSMERFWDGFARAIAREEVEFFEPTEDRETDWTQQKHVEEEEPTAQAAMRPISGALPAPAATDPFGATASVDQFLPATVPRDSGTPALVGPTTTLSSGAGEIHKGQRPALLRQRLTRILAATAVTLLLIGLSLMGVFIGFKPADKSATKSKTSLIVAQPGNGAATVGGGGPVTEALPPVGSRKPARQRTYRVTVTAKGLEAVCRADFEGGEIQAQVTPCKFRVKRGKQLKLKVMRKGFRPLSLGWSVTSDRHVEVEMLRHAKQIVLAGEASRIPKSEARKRGRSRRRRARLRQKISLPADAPSPSSKKKPVGDRFMDDF